MLSSLSKIFAMCHVPPVPRKWFGSAVYRGMDRYVCMSCYKQLIRTILEGRPVSTVCFYNIIYSVYFVKILDFQNYITCISLLSHSHLGTEQLCYNTLRESEEMDELFNYPNVNCIVAPK